MPSQKPKTSTSGTMAQPMPTSNTLREALLGLNAAPSPTATIACEKAEAMLAIRMRTPCNSSKA